MPNQPRAGTRGFLARRFTRGSARSPASVWYPRGFWPSLAAPATLWLLLLYLGSFYTILSVAFGTVDPIFQTPVPIWRPLDWSFESLRYTIEQIVASDGVYHDAFVRTLVYVSAAVVLCLLIGYPVAYAIARYGGRYKVVFLVAMLAPFWISYIMRMLAWVNLLQENGYVNRTLGYLGLVDQPPNWLAGRGSTVVLGLVYGYVPYMILPLYAALDRIDRSTLEAARDLGATPVRTFARVTLPLSKQAMLAGTVIIALPMFGDYYTADLLSGSPRTTMIGNLISGAIQSPLVTQGAALVVILMLMLIVPMIYYLYSTARSARAAR